MSKALVENRASDFPRPVRNVVLSSAANAAMRGTRCAQAGSAATVHSPTRLGFNNIPLDAIAIFWHSTFTMNPRPLMPSEAYGLDHRLGDLMQHINQHRLFVGEALAWLHQHGGALKLGFTETGVYAQEVIQERKHWCEDSRRLAKRLADLPIIRDALMRGFLSWSMAELLARHATPVTEHALVDAARMSTVREMKKRLQPEKPDDDLPAERCTVTATVKRSEAWFLEATRMAVAAVAGEASNDTFAEALIAEGLTRIAADFPGIRLPDTSAIDKQLAEARAQMSGRAEHTPPQPRRVMPLPPLTRPLSTDPLAVHEVITDEILLHASTKLDFAEALQKLSAGNAWGHLGFGSLGHYARERLGMSEQTARNHIQLAHATTDMPELGHAVREGRVGFESARLIGRIASPNTVDSWIARASERTLKHLKEEVEAADLLGRMTGDRTFDLPPDDEALETVNELERTVLRGVVGLPQMSGDPLEATPEGDEPTVEVRLPMRDDLARYWRALERTYVSLASSDMPFVTFLCHCVWEAWRGSEERVATFEYFDVYLRERFRCACPVCGRRENTPHHIVFRGKGGGEQRWNLTGLCSACHLEGVHRYYLSVSGRAPDRLTWTLMGGRWRIEGRKKFAA